MQIFATHLKREIAAAAKNKDTMRLCKLILAYLFMFKKRRPSEVAEITRSTYAAEAYRTIRDNKAILSSLSYAEKLMSTR